MQTWGQLAFDRCNRIIALPERGYAVSPTLAILVDALKPTDIIVHVTARDVLNELRAGRRLLSSTD